jgi:hypothetical protein
MCGIAFVLVVIVIGILVHTHYSMIINKLKLKIKNTL